MEKENLNWWDKPLLTFEQTEEYFNLSSEELNDILSTARGSSAVVKISEFKTLINKERFLECVNPPALKEETKKTPLLTIEEAAEYFSIGANRLREFMKSPRSKEVRFVISDGKVMVKKDKMQKYIEDNRYLLVN